MAFGQILGGEKFGGGKSKREPILMLSERDLLISGLNSPIAVTASYRGGGVLSASSSDANIATVSVSGNTISVTGVAEGSCTITASTAGTDGYYSDSTTLNVTVETVYGAIWDGTSTTKFTRTDGAANFTDPVPYKSGAASYGSPFDNIQPWAGMVKSNNSSAGTVVAIPKFWYKLEKYGTGGISVKISNVQRDGFSVSPAHMNRDDGKGERDVVYVGRYHCAENTYKSTANVKPQASTTRANFRTSIHNLGSNIWQLDFLTRFTLWLLYIVEFADWNSQEKIGYGCGNNSSTENMGYTDGMPYHTGTMQSARETYGLGTQYRNIEGLWDNVYDWIDGCYNNSSGLNIIKKPSSFSDSSGGTCIGLPTSGYPTKLNVSNSAGVPIFYPTEASGGDGSNYTSDYWNFVTSNPCVCGGGNYNRGVNRGLFYLGCSSASGSDGYFGSRLLVLP